MSSYKTCQGPGLQQANKYATLAMSIYLDEWQPLPLLHQSCPDRLDNIRDCKVRGDAQIGRVDINPHRTKIFSLPQMASKMQSYMCGILVCVVQGGLHLLCRVPMSLPHTYTDM